VDDRDGRTHDYRKKSDVLFAEIVVPSGVLAVPSRSVLWNAAEAIEKRKDSRVAREVELALPTELDRDVADVVRGWVCEQITAHGCAADISFHAGHARDGKENLHAHVLITTRALEADGSLGPKLRLLDKVDTLQEWRSSWAEHLNRALERAGSEERVDHRTLAAQGIDREPTIHLRPTAAEMERRGMETERGDRLREIVRRNELAAAERDLELSTAARDQLVELVEAERAKRARRFTMPHIVETLAADSLALTAIIAENNVGEPIDARRAAEKDSAAEKARVEARLSKQQQHADALAAASAKRDIRVAARAIKREIARVHEKVRTLMRHGVADLEIVPAANESPDQIQRIESRGQRIEAAVHAHRLAQQIGFDRRRRREIYQEIGGLTVENRPTLGSGCRPEPRPLTFL